MDLTLPYKKTWNEDKKHIDIGRENREQHFVRIKLDIPDAVYFGGFRISIS